MTSRITERLMFDLLAALPLQCATLADIETMLAPKGCTSDHVANAVAALVSDNSVVLEGDMVILP